MQLKELQNCKKSNWRSKKRAGLATPNQIYYLILPNLSLTNTVPVPIKCVASIQKLVFYSNTMVYFCQILFIFTISDCTRFNKTYLFLIIFWTQLLFKSVHYWHGYGNWKNLIYWFTAFYLPLQKAWIFNELLMDVLSCYFGKINE